jgi:hypothetical protein
MYFIKYQYYASGTLNGYLSKIEVYNGSPALGNTVKIAEHESCHLSRLEQQFIACSVTAIESCLLIAPNRCLISFSVHQPESAEMT